MARCDKSPSISSNTTLCSLGSLFDRNIFYFMQEERISRPNMTPLICCPVAIRVVSQTKYETVLHFKLVAEKSPSCDEEAFRHSPTVTRIFSCHCFVQKNFAIACVWIFDVKLGILGALCIQSGCFIHIHIVPRCMTCFRASFKMLKMKPSHVKCVWPNVNTC